MRIRLALVAFVRALYGGETAERIAAALKAEGPVLPSPDTATREPPRVAARPVRSDAITLLAALQRDSRLIDFLKEPMDVYEDAQIGAAVRDIHRSAAASLDRLLALAPVVEGEDGSETPLPAELDPGVIRLTGAVSDTPPAIGKLAHHGWKATKLDLPAYTGGKQAANVIAPAEVEV